MADDMEVSIDGLEELEAKLQELAGPVAKDCVRKGLNAGGEAIRDALSEMGASAQGEIGQLLGDRKSWSKYVRAKDDLSGNVRVQAKGTLSDEHLTTWSYWSQHIKGLKGKPYHRTLNYLVRMMEGLSSGGGSVRGLSRLPVMTAGFESNKDKIIDRVRAAIEERVEAIKQ